MHIIETNLKSTIMKHSVFSLSVLTVCILFTSCCKQKEQLCWFTVWL